MRGIAASTPMRLTLTLAPDPTAPSRARTSIRALSLGLSPHVLRDLQLVVSELVTHAVGHGCSDGIRVELELRGRDHVRGEIVDRFVAGAPAIERAGDDPASLGLRAVDALTSSWGADAGSTRVWFEMLPRP